MKTVKEIAKELLLKGERINKGQFHAQYNTFTLTQRIEEIRKEGWVIKSKTIPGKRGMVEYWLEPSEIERIKSGLKRDEQSLKEEENIAPQVLNDALNEAQESEDRAYYTEQLGIGLLGGHNY